ncbi:MAG TPA: hypothetical protein PLW81_01530 [Thiobacillaceae bacterium]|nr:hypothetical protein [Thiobacillaceae bacterium]
MKFTFSKAMLAFCLVLMAGIAWLDYATGKNLAVWALYLIPVGLAGWLAGFRLGLGLAFVAALLILAAGLLGGNMFSGPGWFALAIANRFLALAVVAWLASRLYQNQMLESTLHSYEECLDYYHVTPEDSGKTGDVAGRSTKVSRPDDKPGYSGSESHT